MFSKIAIALMSLSLAFGTISAASAGARHAGHPHHAHAHHQQTPSKTDKNSGN